MDGSDPPTMQRQIEPLRRRERQDYSENLTYDSSHAHYSTKILIWRYEFTNLVGTKIENQKEKLETFPYKIHVNYSVFLEQPQNSTMPILRISAATANDESLYLYFSKTSWLCIS